MPVYHNYEMGGVWHHNSGKTDAAAYSVARFIRTTPPPAPHTPFWVLSQNLDMVCRACWGQKLSRFIPHHLIESISWYNRATNYPRSVQLKPHANGHSWTVDFKSYDQDRRALQGVEIAGFWCDEQVPFDVLTEVWVRCRRWDYPGSKLYTLTPLAPDELFETRANNPEDYPDWRFYRMNSRANQVLPSGYIERIVENELEELRETRLTGEFASFHGSIYPMFNAKVHVVPEFAIPRGWRRFRAIDFGYSHPLVCLWAAKEPITGRYFIYREYAQNRTLIEEHIRAIQEGWDETSPDCCTTWADPEDAQARAEFAYHGLATVAADKDVKAGIGTVRKAMHMKADGKPGLLIFESCRTLIRQLRAYHWHPYLPDKPEKVDDDAVDALRYVLHSDKGEERTFRPLNIKKPKSKLYG